MLKQRSSSRLVAIQSLYQAMLTKPEGSVCADLGEIFFKNPVLADLKLEQIDPDISFCQKLLLPFQGHPLTYFDDFIRKSIGDTWSLERLEILLLALFRVAAAELVYVQEAPEKLVINDYVTIAYSFFSGPEPTLVRAILPNMAALLSQEKSDN